VPAICGGGSLALLTSGLGLGPDLRSGEASGLRPEEPFVGVCDGGGTIAPDVACVEDGGGADDSDVGEAVELGVDPGPRRDPILGIIAPVELVRDGFGFLSCGGPWLICPTLEGPWLG
jgi:hypothetical protein